MTLSDKILSDPVTKWVFAHSKNPTYLVGGSLRDYLRNRRSRDRDFVVKKNAAEVALMTANRFKAGFIELQKNLTYRVVLDRKRFIDFTYLKGDISDDLSERDFTINAVAWSPQKGMIAPPGHLDDIRNKEIRVVRPGNLAKDPLRVLRAYRLSAQLDFRIEHYTRRLLKKHAGRIKKVSPERITEELFKILNHKNAASYLFHCNEDEVLSRIIPITSSNLRLNINIIRRLDDFINEISYLRPIRRLKIFLTQIISQNLSRSGIMRLYLLTLLKHCKYRRLNKRRFSVIPELELLTMSSKIKNSLLNIHLADHVIGLRLTDKKLFQIFLASRSCPLEIAIIRTIMRSKIDYRLIRRAEDFLACKSRPLLSGNDIGRLLDIEMGRKIGEAKSLLLEQQFLGNLKSRTDAERWIIANLT